MPTPILTLTDVLKVSEKVNLPKAYIEWLKEQTPDANGSLLYTYGDLKDPFWYPEIAVSLWLRGYLDASVLFDLYAECLRAWNSMQVGVLAARVRQSLRTHDVSARTEADTWFVINNLTTLPVAVGSDFYDAGSLPSEVQEGVARFAAVYTTAASTAFPENAFYDACARVLAPVITEMP